MTIQQISIQNFKAFKEEEVFNVEGKNLLICGNNGSGKSSLHYALHVFFQSSIKGDAYKKYFADPKDSVHGTESLLNIFGNPSNYLVELSVKKTGDIIQKYQIKPIIDVGAESHQHADIKNSDFASDFISHRLLVNFYSFRNSQDANLWFLFEKEVFPYWNDDALGISYDAWLKSLKSEAYDLSQVKETVPDESGEKQTTQNKFTRESPEFKALQVKISAFNAKLNVFYTALIPRVNEILNEFLPEEKLVVDFAFKTPLDIDGNFYWNAPELILKLKQNGTDISRPHVFLNEARLTALALAIRLAMFDKKFKGTGDDVIKLLVLDDLLISLDMDFRMGLIKYIQHAQSRNGSFEGYQLIFLTHEKGLFDVLKNTLAKDVTKWKWFEFFDNNNYPITDPAEYKNPIIIEEKDFLVIAREYLTGVEKIINHQRVVVREKSYELCALFLRKKTEQILKLYYDPEMDKIFRLKILENLERGLGGVEKEWTQKIKQSFEKLFGKKIDVVKIAELKALNLTPPIGEVDEPKKTNDANTFKNNLYSYLEEFHLNFVQHQEDKAKLTSLSKALQEIRGRILNHGAHANRETIFELELRGAIDKITEFERVVLSLR